MTTEKESAPPKTVIPVSREGKRFCLSYLRTKKGCLYTCPFEHDLNKMPDETKEHKLFDKTSQRTLRLYNSDHTVVFMVPLNKAFVTEGLMNYLQKRHTGLFHPCDVFRNWQKCSLWHKCTFVHIAKDFDFGAGIQSTYFLCPYGKGCLQRQCSGVHDVASLTKYPSALIWGGDAISCTGSKVRGTMTVPGQFIYKSQAIEEQWGQREIPRICDHFLTRSCAKDIDCGFLHVCPDYYQKVTGLHPGLPSAYDTNSSSTNDQAPVAEATPQPPSKKPTTPSSVDVVAKPEPKNAPVRKPKPPAKTSDSNGKSESPIPSTTSQSRPVVVPVVVQPPPPPLVQPVVVQPPSEGWGVVQEAAWPKANDDDFGDWAARDNEPAAAPQPAAAPVSKRKAKKEAAAAAAAAAAAKPSSPSPVPPASASVVSTPSPVNGTSGGGSSAGMLDLPAAVDVTQLLDPNSSQINEILSGLFQRPPQAHLQTQNPQSSGLSIHSPPMAPISLLNNNLDDGFSSPLSNPVFSKDANEQVDVGKRKRIQIYPKEIHLGSLTNHVFRGTCLDKAVAVKRKMKSCRTANDLKVEMACLKRLRDDGTRHPNVVKIEEFDEDQNCLYIAMEYCGQTLGDMAHHDRIVPEKRQTYMTNLVNGLMYLHSIGLSHCNLHPGNVFQDVNSDILKIGDIDPWVCKKFNSFQEEEVPGSRFCAPEFLCGTGSVNNVTADVFSLGVLLYFIYSNGDHPFAAKELNFHLHRNFLTQRNIQNNHLHLATELPLTLRGLIGAMLRANPNERPQAMTDVASHPALWDDCVRFDYLAEVSALLQRMQVDIRLLQYSQWRTITQHYSFLSAFEEEVNTGLASLLHLVCRTQAESSGPYRHLRNKAECLRFFQSLFPSLLIDIHEEFCRQSKQHLLPTHSHNPLRSAKGQFADSQLLSS